jgi:molybdopterin/thiamine biosynthesis adenylyltransferase
MPVLDLVAREASIIGVTLIEPDVYKEHNVVRHLFGHADVGQLKAELARRWLMERRPDLPVEILAVDLLDAAHVAKIDAAAARADIGVCAADNEPAKYHFDQLMRRHKKPWTLGEVLAGGIGGFVHWFVPEGPCYGCVASHLQRSVTVDTSRPPDYSQPGGPVAETVVPARKAAIATIAGLHAELTLQLLAEGPTFDPGFTTLLLPLRRVPGVFSEPFRPHRLRIPRAPECLWCSAGGGPATGDLDRSLAEALNRLAEP